MGIPSQTSAEINDINSENNAISSYRHKARNSINKSIASFYDNASFQLNQNEKTGQLIHGAPTKEHRLLEYFLVISYGDELKIRHRSPLMDIFENFNKRGQHRHAYIVHPKQQKQQHPNHLNKHK